MVTRLIRYGLIILLSVSFKANGQVDCDELKRLDIKRGITEFLVVNQEQIMQCFDLDSFDIYEIQNISEPLVGAILVRRMHDGVDFSEPLEFSELS